MIKEDEDNNTKAMSLEGFLHDMKRTHEGRVIIGKFSKIPVEMQLKSFYY